MSATGPLSSRQHRGHPHHPADQPQGRALTRLAVSATLHCLTGCAIGEVLGMVIGTALGWGNGANKFSGEAPAPATSNTTSLSRTAATGSRVTVARPPADDRTSAEGS